jgi:HlyD family secretion protein
VLSRTAEKGQIVAATLNAPILFTLAEDLARMDLQVDIDEADIGRVAVGNEATFTVDAYPGRSFPARITQLRFAPQENEGVVTYKAVLSVENTDRLLRPGMTATATITVARQDGVLLVPLAALRYAPRRSRPPRTARAAACWAISSRPAPTAGRARRSTDPRSGCCATASPSGSRSPGDPRTGG